MAEKGYYRTIPGQCGEKLKLAGTPSTHLNFIVNEPTDKDLACVTLEVKELKWLRDALIELYPLPKKPSEPKVSYEVGPHAKVYRVKCVDSLERTVVGEFISREDAEAFARLKNEVT